MFRRYLLTYVDGAVVMELRGDVPSRRFVWMGALDGVLLTGHRRFVIDLQAVTLRKDSDAAFVTAVAQRIRDFGGAAVWVAPAARDAQRLLQRSAGNGQLVLVDTVDTALRRLAGTSD